MPIIELSPETPRNVAQACAVAPLPGLARIAVRRLFSRLAAVPMWFAVFLGMGVFSLSGCGKEPLYEQKGFVFGTQVEVSIYGEKDERARQLAAQVFSDFDRLHHSLHAWKPGTLARMNTVFANSPARAAIAPGMISLIHDATQLSEQSGGLFNPAIGKLIQLWGFQNDEFKPVRPDPAEIARLVAAKPQMRDIVIDGIEFYSKNPAVKLDLGGYAKGYALDIAADYLRSQGVKNALINIGGNIMALGKHGDRPWRIAIRHPRKPGPLATLDLYDGEAIGTSGDYQRYFMLDGKRYCHIIDPRTGYPAQGVQAVTVIAPVGPRAGVLSDVASKPPFLAGTRGWRQAAKDMGISLALLVDEKGEVYLTSAMKQRLTFSPELSPPPILHVVP
ncbi:MAG: FAD:protein FMN transferase [Burkholderiales bacterium]